MFFQILLLVTLIDLLRNLPGLPPAITDLAMLLNVLSSLLLAVTWSLASLVSGLGLFFWYCASECLCLSYSWVTNKRSVLHALIFLSTFSLSFSYSIHLAWMSDGADWVFGSLFSLYSFAKTSHVLVSLFAPFGGAFTILSIMCERFIYTPSSSFVGNLLATGNVMARTFIAQLSFMGTTLAISSYIYLHLSCKALSRQIKASNAILCAIPQTTVSVAFSEDNAPLTAYDESNDIAPADLLVAAVDHLVQANQESSTKHKEMIQQNKELEIHIDHLVEVQMEFSRIIEDLRSEVDQLKQRNTLLSAENDGLRLLNNNISNDNDELEWKNTLLSQEVDNLKSENDALSCKSVRLDQECEKLDDECTRLDERFEHFKEIMQEVIAVKNREYSNISADLVFVESDLAKRTESPVFQTPISPCFCPCPTHGNALSSTIPPRPLLASSTGSSDSVLVVDADKGGSMISTYFLSEISGGESTLNNSSSSPPSSPSPFASQAVKAKQFASLLETIFLSPSKPHSLGDVFTGNGLGLRLTPPKPSIDAVLAFTGADISSSFEEGCDSGDFSPERGFRTSTPPPKGQLKKRAARLALRQGNENALL